MQVARVLPLAAVALAAALATAGCSSSSSPAADGPLRGGSFGFGGGSDCSPGRLGQPITFGDERFSNHGHTTLVLDRVSLRHPLHVRLVGSFAVPGIGLAGVGLGFPPTYPGLPPSWKHRQGVHGFRLAPGKSFNMVLGVVSTGLAPARSLGMLIYYHDPAGKYVAVDRFAMIIAVGKSECSQ